jgi:type IV secretion system protein VirB1
MLMPLEFMTLIQNCAPQISPITMAAIVQTESGFHPYAIGVVHGRLLRQPSNLPEAIATARALQADGWNFSVGLAQVNRVNWPVFGLTAENAFEPCRNVAVGAAILERCFASARRAQPNLQAALRASLSCYASGDLSTGYRTGYVQRVVTNARLSASVGPFTVPSVAAIPVLPFDSGRSSNDACPRPVDRRAGQQDRSGASPERTRSESANSAVVF